MMVLAEAFWEGKTEPYARVNIILQDVKGQL